MICVQAGGNKREVSVGGVDYAMEPANQSPYMQIQVTTFASGLTGVAHRVRGGAAENSSTSIPATRELLARMIQ